jgi:hypothetical protein
MIYETIHDPEYRKAAESWRQERLRQMDLLIEIHAKLLRSEWSERERLAGLPDGQLALEFAEQTEKDFELLVKRSTPLEMYWEWDRNRRKAAHRRHEEFSCNNQAVEL